MRRPHTLAATTSAVSWTLFEGDDFNIPRIDLVFDTPPTSAGLVIVTKDSEAGSDYDCIIATINPVGQDSISFQTLHGFVSGDQLLVEYANPDGVSITGTASLELPLIGDLSTSGVTADNGIIRSLDSRYVRYSKISLGAISPGASGANWEPSDANALAGWRVDTLTEVLYTDVTVLPDWDTSRVPSIIATYTVMEAGTAVDDIFEIEFVMCYKSSLNQTMRSQTVVVNRVVGLIPQYYTVTGNVEIPINVENNELFPGDTMCLSMQLTANSDIGDIRVNSASFIYPTTHIGRESGDV